jgi:putative endonuclease
MRKLQYCVYVLKSEEDRELYIGFTEDLNRRLTEHIKGYNKATAPRRPFELVFAEFYKAKSDALRRETYFKSQKGKRALRLMLKDSLTEAQ